jgi:nitric oxide reductase subunit B
MNLAIITYAMPLLRGRAPYNQVLNMVSFWLMTGGMAFMTFVLTFAGTIQTHMQRIVGDYYMEVQDQLGLFYMSCASGPALPLCWARSCSSTAQVVVRREIIAPNTMPEPEGEAT